MEKIQIKLKLHNEKDDTYKDIYVSPLAQYEYIGNAKAYPLTHGHHYFCISYGSVKDKVTMQLVDDNNKISIFDLDDTFKPVTYYGKDWGEYIKEMEKKLKKE